MKNRNQSKVRHAEPIKRKTEKYPYPTLDTGLIVVLKNVYENGKAPNANPNSSPSPSPNPDPDPDPDPNPQPQPCPDPDADPDQTRP